MRRPKTRALAAPTPLGGCLLFGFFTVFAVGGLFAFYFTVVQPGVDLVAARFWVAVPCSITSTSVKETVLSGSSNYWPDIRYSFQLDSKEYEGKRYNFSNGTGDLNAANDVLQRYPIGDEITCWVDPDDPSQSVIDRSPGWFLLVGLVPIAFIAIGFGGLWFLSR